MSISNIYNFGYFPPNKCCGQSDANTQGCRALKSKAERKHPDAYAKASRRVDY